MSKAMTLRLEDAVYEAIRQEAFDARVPMSEIIRTAVNAHLNMLFKARMPSRFCDVLECHATAVGITTPGGFHFCAEHLPVPVEEDNAPTLNVSELEVQADAPTGIAVEEDNRVKGDAKLTQNPATEEGDRS